jgi:hypothetical protein
MGVFRIFANVLVGLAVILGFLDIILVFGAKAAKAGPEHLLLLRLVIRRVMFKLFRNCGMRNMIILLLISLVLAYLFSYVRWFNVVMGFCMNTFASSTMLSTPIDEGLGEWEGKIKGLAIHGVKNKKAFVKSANCSWRWDGIDWYNSDYYFKRLKYVLYYDEYFCLLSSRNAVYRLALVDITSSHFRKFSITLPRVADSPILTFFSHEHFDHPTRSKQLQAGIYVSIYKETYSCIQAMKYIADYSGVLVSPMIIYRFRRNASGMH